MTTFSDSITLFDGTVIPIRPMQPSDAPALQRFPRRLSDRSIYLRHFGRMPELSDERARYFTNVDGTNRFAFVALDPENPDEIIAVARYDRDPAPRTDSAEYAALVEDRWQGRGVGITLTRRLVDVARQNGIRVLRALVLPENIPMLRLLRNLNLPSRVIDEDGTMLGIFPPFEALKMAEAKGLDLIEVAPTAKPPTCKIADYGKYKYELKKKEHEARKNQTVITIKEIQLRPRTDQHDLDVKMRQARSFILEGDKVKVNLRFYGREMAHQELGMGLLQKVIAAMTDIAMVESNPKMEGKQLFVLLAPDPAKIKEFEKKKATEGTEGNEKK